MAIDLQRQGPQSQHPEELSLCLQPFPTIKYNLIIEKKATLTSKAPHLPREARVAPQQFSSPRGNGSKLIVNIQGQVIIVLLHKMLIDPRPYTYEYRTPRYGNPTYQSRNLYESLYHRHPQQQNDYFPPNEREMYSSVQRLKKPEVKQQEYRPLERNLSDVKDHRSHQKGYYRASQAPAGNPEKASQGYKLPSINQSNGKARVDTNLGRQFIQAPRTEQVVPKYKGMERFRVYENQQKRYDIINCHAKESQSNVLRNFPKLTLENRLIENGSYHDFKSQRN